MTAPRELLDEEQLIEQQEQGGRPVSASVEWDVRGLPPKQWGSERDPWRRRIESDVLGTVERRLGVTTNEVCARLSVDPTQANRTRAAYNLRALGWRAGAQSQIAGKKLPRRYHPQGGEGRSPGSAHGPFPGGTTAPAAAPPPKNLSSGVDPSDPRTWKLARPSGIEGQPDWVVEPRTGRIVPRPLPRATPSPRVASLLQKRQELVAGLAAVDEELARLQGGPQR